MYKQSFLLFWLSIFAGAVVAQSKFTLSGTIANKSNNETLIGATIFIPETKTTIVSNSYGFYSLTLPQGDYTIVISFAGYDNLEEKINLNANTKKNFVLSETSKTLDEVVVKAASNKINIGKPEMSTVKMSIATIKKMPAVMGEVDVLKSILQLPGVTNAQEGSSGFNVRGGAADGNLVLLDEAVVYNTSHLFGFFSVFNSDVIKDLKLYKGGIPANFGGRTSSLLEIYQKEGNNKEFHATGGIGVVSSRLMLEGPIKKEKVSFVVAGRASYAHLFLKLADEPNSVSFYDLNAKINYKVNDKNNIYLSGYFGKDDMNFNDALMNDYGNTLFNARWNHIFSDKLFSNLSVIYSNYNYGLRIKFAGVAWQSDIKNYNLKYDFKHYISNKLNLSYGLNSIFYEFNPGSIQPFDAFSGVNPSQIPKKYAFENALYLTAEHKLSEKISMNYGLRASAFQRLGPETVSTYANNYAVAYNRELGVYEEAAATGTTVYGKNSSLANFGNLEPRFSIAYSLNNNESVKASYNRMTQYVHLISNTASVSPLDIWAPSDKYLQPQILDQVAVGYFRNVVGGRYTFETEVFYKTIKNRADFIDGADLIAHRNIERVMLNGRARAYGLELLARKNNGKLTGWVAYTLSRAEQQTPGRTADEPGINNGKWYRANYDKTHNLSLTAAYQLTKKWSAGGIFVYQTGKAATFPVGKYEYQGIPISSYGVKNSNSLPAYHHLDLSATYVPKPDSKKRWKSEWVFSIYNVYNRGNAAAVVFSPNTETGKSEAKRMSIFGIIPGVTYNFKF